MRKWSYHNIKIRKLDMKLLDNKLDIKLVRENI